MRLSTPHWWWHWYNWSPLLSPSTYEREAGVESEGVVLQDLEPALREVADKVVLSAERLDVKALLHQEVEAGWKRIGVVVCGPAGLCDDTHAAVVSLGKTDGAIFELEVDAFSC